MLRFSRVQVFVTLWTVCFRQAPLSRGFSRQEYWSGLPFPSPDLPDPWIECTSLVSPESAGGSFTNSITWEFRPIKWKCIEMNYLT